MSLKENFNIQKNEDSKDNDKELYSNFGFNTTDKNNRSSVAFSISDSAYNSMGGSPFSPILLSHTSSSKSPIYHENYQSAQASISPFLESDEHDDVFKVSLEQICKEKPYQDPVIRTSRNLLSNATFRPISTEIENAQRSTSSNILPRPLTYDNNNTLMSRRSISTQTKLSMNYIATYRPNSAPLQEGIEEEELSEINREGLTNIRYRIHRNSTSHSIRSPMPDLILPTVNKSSELFASKLSLIADQIDESINPPTNIIRNPRRTRRFSTPSIAEMTPGGSLLDLLLSIYNAFDNTLPRRRSRQRTASSVTDHD